MISNSRIFPDLHKRDPRLASLNLGAYHPESGKKFQRFVSNSRSQEISQKSVDLTGITKKDIAKQGVPYRAVWISFLRWLTQLPLPLSLGANEPYLRLEQTSSSGTESTENSEDTLLDDKEISPTSDAIPSLNSSLKFLLLSHGGRLADVSMLKWDCKQCDLPVPPEITFGDTSGLIRDRHRRRPVTSNHLPPAWGLIDLKRWLGLPLGGTKAHRALTDAIMTWEVLDETLRRYGTEHLTTKTTTWGGVLSVCGGQDCNGSVTSVRHAEQKVFSVICFPITYCLNHIISVRRR